MKFKKLAMLSIFLLSPLSANAYDIGVGLKAGTTGVGIDLSVALTESLNLRFSSSSYDFGDDGSETIDINSGDGTNLATINAQTNIDLGATGLLLDWYVFDGTFHLTAGLVKNDSTISFDGVLEGTDVTFNGTTYNIANDFSSNQIGAELEFGGSYEPYLGVGWGRKTGIEQGFSFTAEIGVMILDPSVKLTAPVHTDPNVQDDLNADVKAAEADARDDLDDLKLYPVLTIGLNYAF